MRLPLAIPVDSRTGSETKDARMTNAVVESYEGRLTVSPRPALVALADQTTGGITVNSAYNVVCSPTGATGHELIAIYQSSVPGEENVSHLYTTQSGFAPNTASWVERSLPNNGGWKSIAYGNGVFVAIGETDGTVATSVDGTSWEEFALPSASEWTDIAFGNGVFVAIGQGLAAASADGESWTNGTTGTNDDVIGFGGGQFVKLGAYSATASTSSGGLTWSSNSFPYVDLYVDIAYGNGVFVALCGYGSITQVSSNGVTWSAGTLPSTTTWSRIAFGNGLFVAVAATAFATSTDGLTWTLRSWLTPSYSAGIAFGDGVFVALPTSSSNKVAVSTDGITWTEVTMASVSSTNWLAIAYGGGRFVLVSGNYRAANSGVGTDVIQLLPNATPMTAGTFDFA